MMYGFGDARAPLPESIALVDDIVCDFITRMVRPCSILFVEHQGVCTDGIAHCEQTQEACKLSARRGKKLVSPESSSAAQLFKLGPA